MGACQCFQNGDTRNLVKDLNADAIQANNDINGHMKIEEEIDSQTRKLLLLGAGSSGKSTLLKQMRYLYIYKRGYPADELIRYRNVVYENLIHILSTLAKQCKKYQFENDFENKEEIDKLINADIKSTLLGFETNQELKNCLSSVWNDNGIKKTFERRHEYTLMDNASYLLAEMRRIVDDDYSPTFEDIVYTRSVTTGITKENFLYQQKKTNERYELVDVGGQRTERKKWIQCFPDTVAIIFCIALSGYDQVLWEENTVNRMEEALYLLKQMCCDKKYLPLKHAKYIIFLNKKDLFKEKIDKVPFKYKNEFGPSSDYDQIIQWIRNKIISFDPNRRFYFHVTCATG